MKATEEDSSDSPETPTNASKKKTNHTSKPHAKHEATEGSDTLRSEEVCEHFSDISRQIQQDASILAQSVQHAVEEIHVFLQERVKSRPYTALGVAAGAGFICGGGLSLRLTAHLLTLGGRLVAGLLVREALKSTDFT